MIKLKSLMYEGNWKYTDYDENFNGGGSLSAVISFTYSRSILDRIRSLFGSHFANLPKINEITAEWYVHYEPTNDFIRIEIHFNEETIYRNGDQDDRDWDNRHKDSSTIIITSDRPFTSIKVDTRDHWWGEFRPGYDPNKPILDSSQESHINDVGMRLLRELLSTYCCSNCNDCKKESIPCITGC